MTAALIRLVLIFTALALIVLGLNLMNVRDNLVVLVGFIALMGGFVLAGVQVWRFFQGIKK
jgi:hypothetical protein